MKTKESKDIFDKDTALSYDNQRNKLAPIKDPQTCAQTPLERNNVNMLLEENR